MQYVFNIPTVPPATALTAQHACAKNISAPANMPHTPLQMFAQASYTAPALTHYAPVNIPRRVSRGELTVSAQPACISVGNLLSLENGRIAVGGHRGMGQNRVVSQGAVLPQYRENTVKSFVKAAENGAAFVELDVQVTKDGIPVVWHDDIVMYGSPESPQSAFIKDLTFSELQTVQPMLLRFIQDDWVLERRGQLASWQVTDDDVVPTLESIFVTLPENVGIDIEVKMTTPDHVVATPAEEIDRMLSAVLPVVSRYTTNSKRMTFFSSFDPDVCSELRRRQPTFPVMFLSTAGSDPHADPRRTSLTAAIEVAQSMKLEGIVVDTSMLRKSPELVKTACAQGLIVMTYGEANDEPDWIAEQARLGVRAAIVDDVPHIVQATVNIPLPLMRVESTEQMITVA